jgi:hypothetical protein
MIVVWIAAAGLALAWAYQSNQASIDSGGITGPPPKNVNGAGQPAPTGGVGGIGYLNNQSGNTSSGFNPGGTP